MNNHFRPDYTCWHVVSYNNDGTVEKKQTFQGKNDDSSWARGQAWAVYGYTAYRETQDTTFLNFAVKVADMIMNRVKTDDAHSLLGTTHAPVTEETPRRIRRFRNRFRPDRAEHNGSRRKEILGLCREKS